MTALGPVGVTANRRQLVRQRNHATLIHTLSLIGSAYICMYI